MTSSRQTDCTHVQSLLDDYLDGALGAGQTESVELHLDGCMSCRTELTKLKAMLDRVHASPRDIQPDRDLWPSIQAQIETSSQDFYKRRRRLRRASYWSLAAAASILAVLAGVTMLTRDEAAPAVTRPAVAQDPEFEKIQQDYLKTRQALVLTFDERKSELSDETRRVVERNLLIIENAVYDINEALAQRPEDEELKRLLIAAYRSEMGLLERAVKISDSSS